VLNYFLKGVKRQQQTGSEHNEILFYLQKPAMDDGGGSLPEGSDLSDERFQATALSI